MIKNPYVNALAAAAYIAVLVFGMSIVISKTPAEDTLFIPMAMLSLLVLSVALMGVLFFYEPLRLFLDGNRRGALQFFLKTVATFACCAALFISLMVLASVLR